MTQPQSRRVVQVPLYWLVVGIAVMVVSPILSITASAQINKRTIASTIAAAEAAKAEARKDGLVRYCRLIGSQIDVYDEATSEVGKNARANWLREYQLSGCQPPKK